MKYHIPRNVKSGMTFMWLEWKGWLLFVPTVGVFAGSVLFFVSVLKIKFVLVAFIVFLSWFLFKVDENTGAMNFTVFTDFYSWYKSDKIIEPYIDERFQRTETILMKNTMISKETLEAFKKYREQERGVQNEDDSSF